MGFLAVSKINRSFTVPMRVWYGRGLGGRLGTSIQIRYVSSHSSARVVGLQPILEYRRIDPEFAKTESHELLTILDQVDGPVSVDADDDAIAKVVRKWTKGAFTMCNPTASPFEEKIIMRSGVIEAQQLHGRNLYVRHRPTVGQRPEHWESMERLPVGTLIAPGNRI